MALDSVWLIPCYGLIGALLALPWFPGIIRTTGPRPAGYINLVASLVAFCHGLWALLEIWGQPARQLDFNWLTVANLELTFPMVISQLTLGAVVLVTGLNLLAQIYAIAYLEMDWGWARLYSLLGLFESGMCALVLCDSLFFSYFILEILTLGTYLLVGFWFNQSLVVTGARDAFLTKRIGDLFLLMGVLAIWPLTGTFNFTELARWAQTATVDPTVATLVGLALIAGPMGKCAQFPFHLWLDEAMEGPLPSTILRNSVVVATGAWILVKLYPVLALSPVVLTALLVIGSITSIGGSLVALAQIDVKRALSYLVSAYMGLVFIAVGAGELDAALWLTFTYAVAMALLVMAIGSIVWNNVTQNLSQYGGLWSRRPTTGIAFLVGLAGLVALPPLGGFWTLWLLADGLSETHPPLVGVVLLVNLLTTFGLGRVFGLIFLGKSNPMTERSPEAFWPIALPMLITLGFVVNLPPMLWQLGLLGDLSRLNPLVAGMLVATSLVGLSGIVLRPVALPWAGIQDVLAQDFYTAKIYRITVVTAVSILSTLVAFVDRYIVDGLVNLVSQVSVRVGEALKYSTSGQTQFYLLTVALGVVGLMLWTL